MKNSDLSCLDHFGSDRRSSAKERDKFQNKFSSLFVSEQIRFDENFGTIVRFLREIEDKDESLYKSL